MEVPTRTIWFELLKQHRAAFLEYLQRNKTRNVNLRDLADRLTQFLIKSVSTQSDALAFWNAIPAVLRQCDDTKVYDLPMAAEAYAWLHLLDRYVRMWRAFETMVQQACLPLAPYGVNVLDIGTGPGPSTLAVSHFYSALSDYARFSGQVKLIQPCEITAVELSQENNAFRSRFREIAMVPISETRFFDDIQRLDVREERTALRNHLLNQTEYDEYTGRFETITRLTEDEDRRAETLHRYRLVTITNFLTNADILRSVWLPLRKIFCDLRPGAVVVLIGGKEKQYPEIYRRFDKLIANTGLRPKIVNATVASDLDDDEIIIHSARKVADHIGRLSPITDLVPPQVSLSLQNGNWGGRSSLRVYRRERRKHGRSVKKPVKAAKKLVQKP